MKNSIEYNLSINASKNEILDALNLAESNNKKTMHFIVPGTRSGSRCLVFKKPRRAWGKIIAYTDCKKYTIAEITTTKVRDLFK